MTLRFKEALRNAFSARFIFATNTFCYSSLLGVADYAQQRIHGLNQSVKVDWDKWRTCRFTVMGFVLGPMNHFWYRWLDANVVAGSKRVLVLKKVLADLLSSPAFSSVLISSVALMEGQDISHAVEEYARKFRRIFTLDCCVWPPTQFINFWFLPSSCRVLYVGIVQLVYNCCLSYIKHSESDGSRTIVISSRPIRCDP